jgi:hypothetical protein
MIPGLPVPPFPEKRPNTDHSQPMFLLVHTTNITVRKGDLIKYKSPEVHQSFNYNNCLAI